MVGLICSIFDTESDLTCFSSKKESLSGHGLGSLEITLELALEPALESLRVKAVVADKFYIGERTDFIAFSMFAC